VLYNNAYAEAGGWIFRGAVAIPQKSGGFRQDSLSQALGLHGADAYFTILREQRQDLWYIRSSKEIAERGLFVSLKGYEAQVFIDIHEVEDDRRGRFARLHAELNGRGVRDIHAAIQDIYLGELYYRFAELFKRDHLDLLFGVPSGGGSTSGDPQDKTATPKPAANSIAVADSAGSLKNAVLDFVAVAEKFLDGPLYDPFVVEHSREKIPGEQMWEAFAAFLDRLKTVTEYGSTAPRKGDTPTIRFLRGLGKKLIARPAPMVFAYAYGALSLLRDIIGDGALGLEAKALGDHWALDRKLREIFGARDISGDEAGRVLEIMKAVLARTSPAPKTSAEDAAALPAAAVQELSPAEKLVLDNYHAEDFRALLGVNIFEDLIWFNKEAFEEVLFYAPLFAALESNAALGAKPAAKWLDRIAGIAELAEAFAGAEEQSGYQLDGLLGALGTEGARKLRPPAKPKGKK
jgi:hypothetical protein